MSTITPKKPPGASSPATSGRRPGLSTTNSNTPSATHTRSESRTNGQTANGTATATSTMKRERSVRGGPLSARAAARKPAADTPDDDTKVEMQARLDDLQEKLRQSEQAHEDSQKHAAVLQVKLDEALKEQGILEDSVHEHTERIEELENAKKESVRARRELEQIYESEQAAAMKEKEEAQAREEEMQHSLQRMKETLAQRELRDRGGLDDDRRPSLSRTGSNRSNDRSPNPEAGQFAPSSIQRSDSRSSSRILHQKDKIIEGLRLEVAESQIKLVELENKGGGSLQALEKTMYDLKIANARLMEENESFQLLLSEKTLNGEFGQSDLLRPANTDTRPPSRSPTVNAGTSLADELEGHDEAGSEAGDESGKRLQTEVKRLEDQNKALTLYINNIVSRLLQHEQFEQILDKTPDLMSGLAPPTSQKPADTEKELPPPPPPKDDAPAEESQPTGATGLLQRAKSVIGGRPKRPQSTTIQADQIPKVDEPKVNEDPQTAPRIPLGRNPSTRGHKRGNSDWPAASVVTNMYKGPSPGLQGPTSPGLSSPNSGRSSFFGTAAGLGAGSRQVSNSTIPTTISETSTTKDENIDPLALDNASTSTDLDRTNRNSLASTTAIAPQDITNRPDSHSENLDVSSNPSSPPRSTTSSGERESRQGGAVMMGSKPRPLRLVQGAQDDEKAKKAANRGSWFGWMNKGIESATPTPPASSGGGNAGNRFSIYGRSVSGGEQGQQQ